MHNASIDTAPLAGSKTAADGLLAALLAEQGFDTNADVFEHLQGFLKVDVERLFANWTALRSSRYRGKSGPGEDKLFR
jgi:2-methylcitrate dehydratase PrpD